MPTKDSFLFRTSENLRNSSLVPTVMSAATNFHRPNDPSAVFTCRDINYLDITNLLPPVGSNEVEPHDLENTCGHPKCTARACLSTPHLKVVFYGENGQLPFVWKGRMCGPEGAFALYTDEVLMKAGNISWTQYCAYSPTDGCWLRSDNEGDLYFEDTFIIYRPYYVLDADCPGLAEVVRKLHYKIAALHPDRPLLRIPHRYSHPSVENGSSSDEWDDDDTTR